MMKLRLLCFVAVIGLLAGPAMANIFVSTQPEDCVVSLSEGTHTLEVWAQIPAIYAVVGFGFDVEIGGAMSMEFDHFDYNPALFIEMPDGDGDGIQGLVDIGDPPVQGPTLLGYMTFNLVGLGVSDIIFSDDNPDDLNEGFALEVPGEFGIVEYIGGSCEVIPEPSALALLALGGLAILRRR